MEKPGPIGLLDALQKPPVELYRVTCRRPAYPGAEFPLTEIGFKEISEEGALGINGILQVHMLIGHFRVRQTNMRDYRFRVLVDHGNEPISMEQIVLVDESCRETLIRMPTWIRVPAGWRFEMVVTQEHGRKGIRSGAQIEVGVWGFELATAVLPLVKEIERRQRASAS